ncbi:MAG: glycosyltransferase family 2 protein [Leptospiraceae bacterium]|nr:glycosyltransferase family 2 protein [Leptospiraceae bacterium]
MNTRIAVVIPCYRVKDQVLRVIEKIGPQVDRIYVVDDKCPQESGKYVENQTKDPRVKVLYHSMNKGVGGAVISGYKEAVKEKMDIIVKIDGDDQMDPGLLPHFIKPILAGKADYTKGNRFYNLEFLRKMPTIRLIGNAGLSFITKISSGYWDVMDPTNGYTALHCSIINLLSLDKIDNRYFFESDMLFRLNTIRAVVYDIPMIAQYGDEKSNLKVSRVLFEFPLKHLNRFIKRIFYSYFLRDFNIGSIELIFGLLMMILGLTFGSYKWYLSFLNKTETPIGTVMLATLPIILGFQLFLSFIHFDISNIPKKVLNKDIF